MDNTSSNPALRPPNLPASFCPQGSIADVLNEYTNRVIRNTIVLIPGFGSVNIAEIPNLKQQIDDLTTFVNTNLVKEQRNGTGVAVVLNDISTITFAAMPSSAYYVVVTPVDDGNVVATGDMGWSLVPGSKTITQFEIRTHNMPNTWTLDWYIREL